ncbi:MAG: tRNA (adenosine(37)-N6)-threonylcarbamoyltransferase complex dimerization subunit type 1 TsaB [Paracoccaceae bacterium]|nr:tRNA (adenosine(37)-N6)-threonylcarbamoyltransferase complex dimerization subunit type 1 TsaB [Paracoccaceae bacterium]
MILAIDTSAAQCAVALLGGGVLVQRRAAMERGHAEHLFPMIEDALAEAGAVYGDLTRIAVCTGPGSFTGVRIGVAAARGLAIGCAIPVVGITRFEALAVEAEGAATIRLRGRGGSAYCQDFDAAGQAICAPQIGEGAGDDPLPDPVVIARLAKDRVPGAPPAPLYLRGADADPPRDGPPVMLD